ncbi:programmed cell death 1 ligand 1-like isoform X2 [Syngnathus typhle]|uniref:programmed cell death 1 ligand 1-like isoform X2 n=1 Tax=Syngnathus typhle TaxID=161592 RepID=UPI002A6A19E1|nr:programmed cell death 1 ligand 1-like isoform X2 [Syngnathus typhle]
MEITTFIPQQAYSILFLAYFPTVLTVNAERVSYSAQMGGEVLMGCHFYPLSPHPYEDLIVAWSWKFRASIHLVSFLESGLELDSSQHPDFKGRARLLTEEIKDGRAVLQLSRLRINDSGNYECVVRTRNGADYKYIQLSVTAPYKTVTKTISKTVPGGKFVLNCQSEGYPMSTVAWEDGHGRNLNASTSTSVVTTEEGLYRITSGIQVGSSQKNNYTCRFDSNSTSATFLIPGLSRKKQNISREQREEEDISIFTEDCKVNQQLEVLKDPQAGNSSDAETRWKSGAARMQELPCRLLMSVCLMVSKLYCQTSEEDNSLRAPDLAG